jgi:hypothetical protein
MSDVYSSDIANEVLTLENIRGFGDYMEEKAAMITPSLFKLRKLNDSRSEMVVSFSWNQFLSYSICELMIAQVGDKVNKFLRGEGISGSCSSYKIAKHFVQYYVKEITLGNTFIPNNKIAVLEAFKNGTSKAQIARERGITVYQVDKILCWFPAPAYKRLTEVQDRLNGLRYTEVMKDAANAHSPFYTLEYLERSAK